MARTKQTARVSSSWYRLHAMLDSEEDSGANTDATISTKTTSKSEDDLQINPKCNESNKQRIRRRGTGFCKIISL
jgi:hypothetical protein